MADASVNQSTVTSGSIMDRPLSQLTYKELQSIAMLIGLPANLKQSQMLTMVQARQQGRENIVRRMLVAYREQRSRARVPTHGEPPATKRRRLAPKCVVNTASRQLATILPHPPSCPTPVASIITTSPVVQVGNNVISSSLISSTTPPQKQQQQITALAWQYPPAWLAASTTSIDCGPLLPQASDCQATSVEGVSDPGIITTRIQQTLLPNHTNQTSVKYPQLNQYFEQNLMNQQPSIFPENMMQFVNQTQQMGTAPYAYVGGEVGMNTVMYDPFFPTYSNLPPVLTENTLYGPAPVWVQPQALSPINNMETMVSSETCQNLAVEKGLEDSIHEPQTKCVEYNSTSTPPLDVSVNSRMSSDVKQEYPTLNSNTTSIFRCYTRPICSVRSSLEPMLSSASLPVSHLGDDDDCVPEYYEDDGCAGPYSPEDPTPLPLYSQFHDDDKLSLPLIYNYIASTEDLLGQQQQQLQEEVVSQSVSSPEVITQLPLETESSPDQRPASPPVVPASAVPSNPPDRSARSPCCYQADGCMKQLVPDLLTHHETVCPHRPINCPLRECFWKGKLSSLEDHFREIHSEKIVYGIEASHLVALEKIREDESMHFVQETNGKIYLVAAHYVGHLLRVTIQAVAVDKTSAHMKGSLEVVGSDGHPYGWWGSVHSVGRPLFMLWNQGLCLAVDPEVVGTYDGCITIHSTVFNAGPLKKGGRKRLATASSC